MEEDLYSNDSGQYDERLDAALDELTKSRKELVRTRKALSTLVTFLVILCLIVGAAIFLEHFNGMGLVKSNHRVLVLTVLNDSKDKDSDFSDSVQIKNALNNGGLIRVDLSEDNLFQSFDRRTIQTYAALDENGSYWPLGALLNYIASNGWTLVEAPDNVILTYYFVK